MLSGIIYHMRYFTNTFAAFRQGPSTTAKKNYDIPQNNIVEYLGEPFFGWAAIEHNGKFGYIANSLVEPYVESLPKDCVDITDQTPEKNDFDQYFMLNGIKQTNWCGPIAVAYILGIPLRELAAQWEVKEPSLWKRIKGAGRFSGTTADDLIKMFSIFGANAKTLESATRDPWLNRSRYTPRILKTLSNTGRAIVSCKIDATTGRLKGSVAHWAVLIDIELERSGGIVTIMNPASNRFEQCTYDRFLEACPYPYGVFLENE